MPYKDYNKKLAAGRKHNRKYRLSGKHRSNQRKYAQTIKKDAHRRLLYRLRQQRYKVKLKSRVYAAYGGFVCACCGITEPKFLTIDHIHENGADHRRQIGERGNQLYFWLVRHKFPPGFQVLCWNCNRGKWINHGTCPHKQN